MNLRKKLAVRPRGAIRLAKIDAKDTAPFRDKKDVAEALDRNIARLNELQYRLYAENRRAVLVILQGMDTSGKDGTIRHVMTGLNPQGCTVTPFKKPSDEELDHDFLWRIHKAVPARGEIGIFNRSHYEDVLVVRVHNLAPGVPWKDRYAQINAFEKLLVENGTAVLKFFLHIDRDEQRDRLRDRLKDRSRHWKLSEADFSERRYWADYQRAYEDALSQCSTPWAPWYVIPANRKWFRNWAVSQILVETLEEMDPKFPRSTVDVRKIKLA